jgi:hypothetical protein
MYLKRNFLDFESYLRSFFYLKKTRDCDDLACRNAKNEKLVVLNAIVEIGRCQAI